MHRMAVVLIVLSVAMVIATGCSGGGLPTGSAPPGTGSPSPSAAATGTSTSSGTAAASVTPTPTPAPTPTPTPAPTPPTLSASVIGDCIPYDPAALAIEDLGADGWRLNSGTSAMVLTDNHQDAERALALAQLNTQLCFFGRDNSRPDRSRYIATFWTGPSGAIVTIPPGAIPGDDCISYDPTNLTVENLGADGWRLNSGSSAMVLLDNESDANKMKELAGHYTKQCFIGRDNARSDRYRYIIDYWK